VVVLSRARGSRTAPLRGSQRPAGAAAGGGHVNVDLVHVSLVPVFVRGFDNHMAANDLRTGLLEALSELVYARLESR